MAEYLAQGFGLALGLYLFIGFIVAIFALCEVARDPTARAFDFDQMLNLLMWFILAWPAVLKIFDNNGPWRG